MSLSRCNEVSFDASAEGSFHASFRTSFRARFLASFAGSFPTSFLTEFRFPIVECRLTDDGRRLGVAFETRVPAEGVEHERVEVVAEEAENQVEEREWRVGSRD